MADYLQIEELPKNYQLYLNQLKSMGYDDIRKIYLYTFPDGDIDLNFWLWIDVEDMIDGTIKSADEVRTSITKEVNPSYFGIDGINYVVRYKNKHRFADKILPDLKKTLKSSEYGPLISSIRFNANEDMDEPIVTVITKKNIKLTWDSMKKVDQGIREILNNYKRDHGLGRMGMRVK